MLDDNIRHFPSHEQIWRSKQAGREEPVANGDLLKDPNLGERQGNYLFTFGLPGAGKSTFQCYLTRWLYQGHVLYPDRERRFSTWANPPDPDCLDSACLYETWARDVWPGNFFPSRTRTGEGAMREMVYKVRPTNGLRDLDFGFLEVSGELMRDMILLDPDRPQKADFSETFRKYLDNPKVRTLFVLLVSPDQVLASLDQAPEESDRFFQSLLTLTRQHSSNRRARAPHIAVVVSEPQKVRAALPEIRKRNSELTSERSRVRKEREIREFVALKMPGTAGMLDAWPGRVGYAGFDLGPVKEESGYEAGTVKSIDGPRLDHAEEIFDWIYRQFTGRSAYSLSSRLMQKWLRFQRYRTERFPE